MLTVNLSLAGFTHNDAAFYPHVDLFIQPNLDSRTLHRKGKKLHFYFELSIYIRFLTGHLLFYFHEDDKYKNAAGSAVLKTCNKIK